MITKIISGGQTGADQGGLSAGAALGVETGGWMPRGFRTDDGPRPDLAALFGMKEHELYAYPPRTARNVHDSDGTVWFGYTSSPGYICTRNATVAHKKPFLTNPSVVALQAWVRLHDIHVLNVAGNRESTNKGIGDKAFGVLTEALDNEEFVK